MLIGTQDKVLNAHDLSASYKDEDYVPCRLMLVITSSAKTVRLRATAFHRGDVRLPLHSNTSATLAS